MLWVAGLGYLVEYHDWGKVVVKRGVYVDMHLPVLGELPT
jgi:hypothetical protein